MSSHIKDIFDGIKAEEKLKNDTLKFLEVAREKQNKKRNFFEIKKMIYLFASLFIFFILGGFSHKIYFSPVSYVDIDINPAIKLTINRFDKVIGTYSYNSDGAKVLEDVKVKYKNYEDSIELIMNSIVNKGYINNSELVSVTVQTENKVMENKILENVERCISRHGNSHGYNKETEVFLVNEETRTIAHENNITPAKYMAILELKEVDETITLEGCRNHSIAEIKNQTHNHNNIESPEPSIYETNSNLQDENIPDEHGSNHRGKGCRNHN